MLPYDDERREVRGVNEVGQSISACRRRKLGERQMRKYLGEARGKIYLNECLDNLTRGIGKVLWLGGTRRRDMSVDKF